MKNKVTRIALVLLAALGLGMSGAQHTECFRQLMGIDKGGTGNYKATVQACFDKATAVPDDYNTFLKRLKSEPAFSKFSYGAYGHRLLFHWGFQADPRKHAPMAAQVKKAGLGPEAADRFYGIIITEQIRRNSELMKAVGATFGIAKKDDRQAVAALLYDTHLVGDYIVHSENTETTRDAVQPLTYVVTDVQTRLHCLLKDDPETAARIGDEVQAQVARDPYNGTGVFEVMQKNIPAVIKKRFGQQLTSKGIVLAGP